MKGPIRYQEFRTWAEKHDWLLLINQPGERRLFSDGNHASEVELVNETWLTPAGQFISIQLNPTETYIQHIEKLEGMEFSYPSRPEIWKKP